MAFYGGESKSLSHRWSARSSALKPSPPFDCADSPALFDESATTPIQLRFWPSPASQDNICCNKYLPAASFIQQQMTVLARPPRSPGTRLHGRPPAPLRG